MREEKEKLNEHTVILESKAEQLEAQLIAQRDEGCRLGIKTWCGDGSADSDGDDGGDGLDGIAVSPTAIGNATGNATDATAAAAVNVSSDAVNVSSDRDMLRLALLDLED